MPKKRSANSEPPPEPMTWKRASPIIIASVFLDTLRIFFEQFWFFGPATSVIYCASKLGGSDIALLACSSMGMVIGSYGSAAIGLFGIVMAMAIGLISWLGIGLWLVLVNPRIFTKHPMNPLWFAGGFVIGEIPFIGTLPGLTGAIIKMYHSQIQDDAIVWKAYEEELAQKQREEQNRQVAEFIQLRNAQAAQSEIY